MSQDELIGGSIEWLTGIFIDTFGDEVELSDNRLKNKLG